MKRFKLAPLAALVALVSHSTDAAVYQLIEIDTVQTANLAFSSAINNSGDVAVIVEDPYNPPIDLSLLNFELAFLVENLTDIDAAQNGNFNATDYQTLENYIKSNSGSFSFQKLADYQSYVAENGTLKFVPGFDEVDAELGQYSQSTDTRIQGVNDAGVIVGVSEGKTFKVPYTNEIGVDLTYVVREFGSRAFVDINGVVVGLVSESDLAGGFSAAYDITNGLLVAGFEVLSPTESFETAVANCSDDEERGDLPFEQCIQARINSGIPNFHQERGVLWQLDMQGNVTSKQQLGLPFTPEEDSTAKYISRALAVNENGVAVGVATNFYDDRTDIPRLYATVFNGEEVTTITERDEFSLNATISSATDINNNNQVVGYEIVDINGIERTKFFVYSVDSNEITFPTDFFPGSASVARAINDQGQVVGEGEVDSTLSGTRRKHGFLYDIGTDTFQNLNDLLPCNSPYTIVQANDINENGEIAALALVNRTDLDITGQPNLNEAGDEILADTFVSVKLSPIPGGEIDNCDPAPEEVQERSSGSVSWFGLAALLLVSLRRRFFK